jgi:hypothetical protein
MSGGSNIKEAITAWLWAEDQKAAESLPSGRLPLVVAVQRTASFPQESE